MARVTVPRSAIVEVTELVGPAAATNEIVARANRFQAPVASHETLRAQAANVTFCASRDRFWPRYGRTFGDLRAPGASLQPQHNSDSHWFEAKHLPDRRPRLEFESA
jgi:hypothetical protein